jgi:hypothetical protein
MQTEQHCLPEALSTMATKSHTATEAQCNSTQAGQAEETRAMTPSTPTPGEAAKGDELRELALRIAEIHPPVVDGRWDGERSKIWVLQTVGLLSRYFPPAKAAQVAVEAAASETHDDENQRCSFCREQGFDLIGLKSHLQNGDCERFENLERLRRL